MGRILVTIIFLGASVMLLIGPVTNIWAEVNDLLDEREEFNEALINSRKLQDLRDELLEEYNSISSDDIEKLDVILPQRADVVKLVVDVEGMAESSGLLITNVGLSGVDDQKKVVSDNQNGSQFNSFHIDLHLAGSYKAFLSFLGSLEKSLRIIEIEEITFSSGDIDLYKFDVKIKSYWKS